MVFGFNDEFSRFSNAVIIKSKSRDIIIKMFLKYWISLFGSPNTVFSDKGDEFVSNEFDYCMNFSMEIKTKWQKLLGVMVCVNVTTL